MNDKPSLDLAQIAQAVYAELLRNPSSQLRETMIAHARDNPPVANYFNNPWRAPMVQGGMALRNLRGLDPTDQQRLEDAFFQFPARDYGRFPK